MIYLLCLWLAHFYRQPYMAEYKKVLEKDLISGKSETRDDTDNIMFQYRLASNLPVLLTISPAMIALLIYFFILAGLGFLIVLVYITDQNPYSSLPHYLCLFLLQFFIIFVVCGLVEIYIAAACRNGKIRRYYDDPLQLPIKIQYELLGVRKPQQSELETMDTF